jgi:hypothetical protein
MYSWVSVPMLRNDAESRIGVNTVEWPVEMSRHSRHMNYESESLYLLMKMRREFCKLSGTEGEVSDCLY